MNGPSGCDSLPPAPAAAPLVLGAISNDGEEPISFEEMLDEETSEISESSETESEDADKVEKDVALPLFPLFSPPHILFVQTAPPPAPPPTTGEAASVPAVPEAVEHKLPPPLEPAPPPPEQIAEKGVIPREKRDGMYTAKASTMVFTNSNIEDPVAAQETLPLGIEYIDSPGFEKTVKVQSVVEQRHGRESVEAPEAIMNHPAPSGPTRLDTDLSSHDFSPIEEPHRLALKTADGIGGHVQLLKTTGQDRLEVVLRPDSATQLHLQITKADGLIQVRVCCEKGDFNMLDANWTTVQSSLAAHGIRVEPLQPSVAWDANSQGRHGSSPREQDRQTRAEFIFEQDQPTKTPGSPSPKPASWQNRGWQRWA